MKLSVPSALVSAGRAALVPVVAGAVALGGLCAWTASGAAPRPPAVKVEEARVLVPLGRDDTAAFFRVRNTGDVDDELIGVEAPTAGGAMLSRTVVRKGAGHMEMVQSAPLPAGRTLEMTPHGLDVMVWAPPRMKPGDRLPVVLRFREAGTVRVEAEVVRAGSR
ncbi:copper chaperone PCu(A)C [Streptomyces klenkii]|uniref:copper chaperone PCu(A)C n=1 Tax=Streptomyces klenkii TaxID=1420899 RepID=UPI0033BD2995